MLFREHQANYPDGEAQQRPKEYSFADFRDEFEILGKSVVFPIIWRCIYIYIYIYSI